MTDSPTNDPAREVRRLLRSRAVAALATALPGKHASGSPEAPPWPFASLVTYALDATLQPLLLLSQLADHTRALQVEARCTLLVEATAGYENPQAGPRVGLLCRAQPEPSPAARRRFLARHPAAETYAGFGDFAIWRLAPERLHCVGGFARARWLEWPAVAVATPGALQDAEADIVAHMNADHGEALDLYAARLLQRPGRGWRMTGIDSEGCDLRLGGEVARLEFPAPVVDAGGARRVLVELAAEARGRH